MVVGGQFAWPVGSAPPSPSARDNSAKSRLVRSTRSSRASRSPTQDSKFVPFFIQPTQRNDSGSPRGGTGSTIEKMRSP